MGTQELLVKTAGDLAKVKTVNDILNKLIHMRKKSLGEQAGYAVAVDEMTDFLLKNF